MMKTSTKFALGAGATLAAFTIVGFVVRRRAYAAVVGPPEVIAIPGGHLPTGNGPHAGGSGGRDDADNAVVSPNDIVPSSYTARGLGRRDYDRAVRYAEGCGLSDPHGFARRNYVSPGRTNQPCPNTRRGRYIRYRVVRNGTSVSITRRQFAYVTKIPQLDGWMTIAEMCAKAGAPALGHAAVAERQAIRAYLSNSYDSKGNITQRDITGRAWAGRCAAVGKV